MNLNVVTYNKRNFFLFLSAFKPMKYAVYHYETNGQCDEDCARKLCEAYGTTLPRVYNEDDFQTLSSVMWVCYLDFWQPVRQNWNDFSTSFSPFFGPWKF